MKLKTPPRAKPVKRRADTIVFAEPMNGKGIKVPESAHTYDGFLDWALSDHFPERGRITYLNGRVYVDLTMEELEGHNKVKTEVTRVIANINVEEDLGTIYSDGARIASREGDVSHEPDAVFCLWDTLESGQVRLIPRRSNAEQYMVIQGAPDWVLEIVSDSSVTKDKRQLRSSYHNAGIHEYWLIDARKKLDFQILVWSETGYRVQQDEGWQKSEIFKRAFRLTRSKDRMGLWRYQLETRP